MTEHALDRQMRLAGVGGSKHRRDAGAGSSFVVERCRGRESHIFRMFLLAPAKPAYFQKCLTLRRIWGRGLSSGTTLERKAPESQTRPPVLLRSPQHLALVHLAQN